MIARVIRALVLMAVGWAAVMAGPRPAIAGDAIEIVSARLQSPAGGEGWVLAAEFSVPLSGQLEEAVSRGVALYFMVEFELVRPRWYWWDEKTATESQTYRLSYHALTRQYRVSLNGFQQSFASLADAMAAMSRVRWTVLEATRVSPGAAYEAQVRMRLDVSMLPKPFQVTAITDRDWNLQAEWKRFRFNP